MSSSARAGRRRHAVQAVEDAQLQRRGVLELVHQRHRVLLQDARAQLLRRAPLWSGSRPRSRRCSRSAKTEAAAWRLSWASRCATWVAACRRSAGASGGQRVQRLLQVRQLGRRLRGSVGRRRAASARRQALGREAAPGLADVGQLERLRRVPSAQAVAARPARCVKRGWILRLPSGQSLLLPVARPASRAGPARAAAQPAFSAVPVLCTCACRHWPAWPGCPAPASAGRSSRPAAAPRRHAAHRRWASGHTAFATAQRPSSG
jgi:hypothetical protein